MKLKLACIVVLALMASGCASIVTGSNESLSVDARYKTDRVKDASCELDNDKGKWFVSTPGSVTVHRSYSDLQVTCDKDGYDDGIAIVKSFTKGMMAGNLLFGGIIGGAVDASTGAAYDYPSLITVQMGKTIEIEKKKEKKDESHNDTSKHRGPVD